MNVTETTLSQLPSLLESKENLSNANFSIGTDGALDSFVDKTTFDNTDFVDKTVNSSYNSNKGNLNNSDANSIEETNTPILRVLDNLEDIIAYDTYHENDVTTVKQQVDNGYHSEENRLESIFSLEIYEKEETKNDLSATQWSKGNVIINNKLLEEPVHVPIIHAERVGQSCGTPCIQEYVVKTEANVHQENNRNSNDSSLIQGITESMNTSCIGEGDTIVNDNTLYFQSSNQDQSLDQSEVSVVPRTPDTECKQLENFTTFTNEIRKDILENKPGMSFSQVASQMVAKSNSLHDSQDEKKEPVPSTKPPVKTKENAVKITNKSMLEFVSKKLLRSYPTEEAISFDINEVRMKLLEKSRAEPAVESNLSSEESDGEEVDELQQYHDASNIMENDISEDLNEKWNLLMESVRNESEVEKPEDTINLELNDMENTILNGSTDRCIHSILLKKYRFRLIGTHDKNWFYTYRKSLGVVHVEHLYKLVTFHKHLRTYQVPCTDLEDCTFLDKHFLHTVLNLELRVKRVRTSDQNATVVKAVDKVFSMNGIGLLLRRNNSRNEFSVLLTHVPRDLATFSSKDAAELVKLATLNKPLEACRPVKVQKLIQDVSEEYCANHPLRHTGEVISELVAYWFEHIRSTNYCPLLYGRMVLFELYAFPQAM